MRQTELAISPSDFHGTRDFYHPPMCVRDIPSRLFSLDSEPSVSWQSRINPAPSYPRIVPPSAESSHSTEPATIFYPTLELSKVTSSSAGLSSIDLPRQSMCEYCGIRFCGRYAAGNLRRHQRTKHSVAGRKEFECKEPGCNRMFLRTDARLKHYRRHHPELAGLYVPRK